MEQDLKYKQFVKKFNTDDKCLEWIKKRRYSNGSSCPRCHRPTKFFRVRGRKAYACQYCGHHIYPLAGTIFHKSSTPLSDWFFAIYIFTKTKTGRPAADIQRTIGVTYK